MTFSSVWIVTAMAGMLSAATTTDALKVVAPSEGMTVVANSPYTVEWTGASTDARFDIDLHYCGSYAFCYEQEDNCGFYIATLCRGDEPGNGCIQGDGSSEVTMPEPLADRSGDGYRVRINEVGGSERSRCSKEFFLMSTHDAPRPGEMGGPEMAVVSPNAESVAVAGEEYTVEFDYDNGFGEREGRFRIDLYRAQQGQGDCGRWMGTVCDKPDIGCHDTQGDYDVVIPKNMNAGLYSIRVGLFGDDSVFACSQAFEVVPAGEALWGKV